MMFLLFSLFKHCSLNATLFTCEPPGKIWVPSLGQEDPPEKGVATHSSILAWRITWTEELCGLQSMGSQRVRHNWATNTLFASLSFSREKAMSPNSSTVAWKIPWMEEPGRLQSMGSLRVGHDWATSLSFSTFMHWRRKWQPSPVLLPGESHGRRSLVDCSPWGRKESDTTEAT